MFSCNIYLVGLECPNCVLQWRYVAGNNWGMCEDGTGAVGCGPQEEFRACADITIGDKGGAPPLRPVRPGTKTTPRAKITDGTKTTHQPDTVEEPIYDGTTRYIGAIVISITALLVVLCLLAAIYLYHYHGQRVKQLMHWNKKHQKSPMKQSSPPPTSPVQMTPTNDIPVPPPRTKRPSQSGNEVSPFESSAVSNSYHH